MNNLIINKTINFIKNNFKCTDYELEKIKYGLEGIYLTITKIIIILVIAIIFNYLDIVLLTLLFFNTLRFFAFGLHAKKSWQCLVMSIIEFNILPLLLAKCDINNSFLTIVFLVSFVSFLLFAPADTEKRPLKNKKKRIKRKVFSIFMCILLFLIAIHYKYFIVPIVSSLIIESLMINPICYKLLGLKYKNYKE